MNLPTYFETVICKKTPVVLQILNIRNEKAMLFVHMNHGVFNSFKTQVTDKTTSRIHLLSVFIIITIFNIHSHHPIRNQFDYSRDLI